MAEPVLEALLEVQAHDVHVDQLHHRRESLPERLALAEREAALARLDTELEELRGRLSELDRSQRRLQDEIAVLEAKAAEEDKRLYGGTVSSPRELQAIQDEIDGLRRRARSLEDDLLDVMEAAEPVTADVARLEEERDGAQAEADRLREVIAQAEAAIARELAEVTAARNAVVGAVPADLVATYEQIRTKLGGVGAARLEGNRCTGCHLTLPATEVAAAKRATPGAVIRHEECGRILVP